MAQNKIKQLLQRSKLRRKTNLLKCSSFSKSSFSPVSINFRFSKLLQSIVFWMIYVLSSRSIQTVSVLEMVKVDVRVWRLELINKLLLMSESWSCIYDLQFIKTKWLGKPNPTTFYSIFNSCQCVSRYFALWVCSLIVDLNKSQFQARYTEKTARENHWVNSHSAYTSVRILFVTA